MSTDEKFKRDMAPLSHEDLRALVNAQRRIAELEKEVRILRSAAWGFYEMGVEVVFGEISAEFTLLTVMTETKYYVGEWGEKHARALMDKDRSEMSADEVEHAERMAKFWANRIQKEMNPRLLEPLMPHA